MEENKKKILILVDWFAPGFKAGGPIRSCVNLALALKGRYEIYVLTSDTDHGETEPYEGVPSNEWIEHEQTNAKVYYAQKKTLTLSQIQREITFVDADYVYLNHLFSPRFVVYPIWLKYRGKIKGKLIVCPRGALYASALSLKMYKKRPLLLLYKWMAIHKQIIFHATNEREKAAIEYYFPGSTIIVADNLPDTRQRDFNICIKESGSIKCIFIARIVPIKNLLFLIRLLQNIKARVKLTVAGPVENEMYWQECKKGIGQLPVNISVTYIGPKKNDEAVALLQDHHLFISPTTGENFGHSIFEALLAGRPVLISDQTPWLNLSNYNAGWDVPLNEPGRFVAVIEKIAGCNQQQFDEYAKSAWLYANNFINNPALTQQYNQLFS